jgi:iron complex outermembrane recepter protein
MQRLGLLLAIVATACFPARLAASPQDPPQQRDVTDIDLDDLMKVSVTSPGRKAQPVTIVPSAVHVLRGEDIKRTGATSLAEALRAVPGMHVARTRANAWAVSARGFNSTSANKMLVLIDGRSVYSPLHSGVFWEVQDTFLEDVDRIEVVRGPGASLWGANAINGVVNIITKRAQDTTGEAATAGAGTEERLFGGGRAGFKAGEDAAVRVYAKYFTRDDALEGVDQHRQAYDGMWMGRAGFRSDWKGGDQDRLTLMGDFYDGQTQARSTEISLTAPPRPFKDRNTLRGGDLVFRWERAFDATSNVSVQAYYDYTLREADLFTDIVHTGDLDFQHRLPLLEGHDVIWGLGYRVARSELQGSFSIQSRPRRHLDDVPSAFFQDEITLVKDHLRLTVGSKFEYNDYSGFEASPSLSLGWNPDDRQTVWFSAARAVRTPSILDVDIRLNAAVFPAIPPGNPTVLALFGDRDFKAEDLLALEAGYRVRPFDALSIDLAIFYNRYRNLRTIETGAPFTETDPPPTHDVNPFILGNKMHAQSGGGEITANFQPIAGWLLQVNYSYLRMNLDLEPGSTDTFSVAAERQNPRHQVWVRSAMDLPGNLTLDVMGRFVSRLSAFDVDRYFEADVRLAWRDASGKWEAAVVGQNLGHKSHAEFNAATSRSEIERGVYASLTCRF